MKNPNPGFRVEASYFRGYIWLGLCHKPKGISRSGYFIPSF
jgi:hypothetical protein